MKLKDKLLKKQVFWAGAFGKSILNNSNWGKLSEWIIKRIHNKKIHIHTLEQSETLFEK